MQRAQTRRGRSAKGPDVQVYTLVGAGHWVAGAGFEGRGGTDAGGEVGEDVARV